MSTDDHIHADHHDMDTDAVYGVFSREGVEAVSMAAEREELMATIGKMEQRRDKLRRAYAKRKTPEMRDRLSMLNATINSSYEALRLMHRSDDPVAQITREGQV